jgi:membrane protein involved in D-alanine export
MNFYLDPAFFVLLVPIVAVAVVLGVTGRSLRGWGCVASLAMLALMFGRDPAALAYAAAYLAGTVALAFGVLRLFRGADGSGENPHPHAVALYRAALALQVAPLAVYKVGVLVNPDVLGFLGISYITFKAVQVLIEIRDGVIVGLRPVDLLYFLSFFPTFTSGPILRSRAFEEQVNRHLARDAYLELLYRGAGWFALGALYKFVGAPLAQWALWFAPSAIGTATPGAFALTQLTYAFAYGLDLFFDFAGYSAMAVGVGYALGVEVPRNFRAPFAAVDIKDFWNRWHITLSYWLRDFVFMRFTSAALKRKLFKTTLTTACVAFVLEFLLMGLWHGITLDYLVYGLYHGLLLAGCEVLQKKWSFYKRHKKQRWFKLCSWAVTMVCVFFGFALFSGQVLHPVGV